MVEYKLPDGRVLRGNEGFTLWSEKLQDQIQYGPGYLKDTDSAWLEEHLGIVEQAVVENVPSLDDVKSSLLRRVDNDAEAIRLKYITPGDGKAMVYREKFEEAKAVDGLGEAAANAMTEAEYVDSYPILAASIPTQASTLWQISQIVIAKAEVWADLAYKIEKACIDGKAAIQAAETVEQANSAYASISWE